MPARRRAPLRCASPWGWPRRSLALGRFASVEARVRVPIRRAMSLYPQDPVRPVCAGALGCGVCGGSECVECPAVPPSSVQFLPVLASSGGFVVSCGEFLAVCASARECLEFATVPAGLYRCFSSSHSVPALTGVGVKFGLTLPAPLLHTDTAELQMAVTRLLLLAGLAADTRAIAGYAPGSDDDAVASTVARRHAIAVRDTTSCC